MEEKKRKIIQHQREIYQGDRIREENNGNIQFIDISNLTDEQLQKIIIHYSLKKDKTSIDEKGIKSVIGRNSDGIDKLPAIYFSYGIEGVLETWDVWLRWRADQLYNPRWQEQGKNVSDGMATEQEKKEYYYRKELWDEEFASGEYRDDKEKMDFLFEFQIDEMSASNYYLLDLKEGKDFYFDEIDAKKEKSYMQDRNSINYRKFKEMYGSYSNIESQIVDKWNMNTPLGKSVTILPEKIRQLCLHNGRSDCLSIILFLYDKYMEITPQEQRVEFNMLDSFIEYIKEKIKNNELQTFDRNVRINEIESIMHFHDQKSDEYFQDMQTGRYSISELQIGKATAYSPVSAKENAQKQVVRDEQEIDKGEKDVK